MHNLGFLIPLEQLQIVIAALLFCASLQDTINITYILISLLLKRVEMGLLHSLGRGSRGKNIQPCLKSWRIVSILRTEGLTNVPRFHEYSEPARRLCLMDFHLKDEE